jgi:hypothetical protein
MAALFMPNPIRRQPQAFPQCFPVEAEKYLNSNPDL